MQSRTLSNITLVISALVLLSAAAAGGYLSWRWLEHSSSRGAESGVDSAAYAALGSDVALTDHNGKALRLSDLRGKVVMLFFGYTHCPDICPATLYSMAQANALLNEDGGALTGIFITVDPARDSAERLREYVTYFDSTFIGLTGSDAQLARVAKDFGAAFEKGESAADGGYLMGHTTFGYLLNQQGKVVQLLQATDPPEVIAKAARALL
jgi:protein SCO1/2